MNIRDVKTGTYRPDQLRNGAVGDAAKAETRATTHSGNSTGAPQDRVELSAAASPGIGDSSVQEMAFARKALLGIPPLSDDRAGDILKRIQEGYYSQPEVLKAIAQNLTQQLKGDQ